MTKKLWFRARTYGYGWTPSSWEGWLSLAIYVVCIFVYVMKFVVRQLNGMYGAPTYYHFIISGITAAFIFLCYKKGEKPGWRWGQK